MVPFAPTCKITALGLAAVQFHGWRQGPLVIATTYRIAAERVEEVPPPGPCCSVLRVSWGEVGFVTVATNLFSAFEVYSRR